MRGYQEILKDLTGIKDYTEFREINESRFKNMFDSTPQGIAIADRKGAIINANLTWMRMFGYTESDLTRLHINDLRSDDDKLHDLEQFDSLLNNELEQYNVERKFIRKDGTHLWCNISARLIEDPEAMELCAIGVYIDITERKYAENEFKRFHGELESIVAERTDEIKKLNLKVINSQEIERQRIARDLHDGVGQTILAAKYAFNNFSRDNFRDEKHFARGMQLIEIASRELREIYSGLYPAMLGDLGLDDTIRWYIRNYLESSGLNVAYQYNIKSAISHTLALNIYRIIQELFNNIIKHSGADRVNVFLQEENKMIAVIISDNGSGFDAVKAEKKTAGAGLANIRQRVEYLRGSIDINSGPGNSTVIIDLPVETV